MITIKLKLKEKQTGYQKLLKQFNNVVRYSYNRYCDNKRIKDSDIIKLVKTNMNNIEQLDASIIQFAVAKSKQIYKTNGQKVIFGGKTNYKRYLQGLIKKEQFNNERKLPLRFVGRKEDSGNRKFSLDLRNDKIIFKQNRSKHFCLKYIVSKNQKELLKQLQEIYDKDKKLFSYTIQLNQEYIWFTFDQTILKNKGYKPKSNRIASIDQNPNYISLVISDGNKHLLKTVFSLKEINNLDKKKSYKDKENKIEHRKYLHNKRKYETLQISKRISQILKQYKVQTLILQDLNIKSLDKKKGKRFNKLVNNFWIRKLFSNNLNKRCNLIGIQTQEVFAGYSSIKGQLQNQNEVDSIAAAIQIGKRKDKDLKGFGNTKVEVGKLSNRWKKEVVSNFKQVPTWKDISEYLKKKYKMSYRYFFSEFDKNIRVSYRLNSDKSYIKSYIFI